VPGYEVEPDATIDALRDLPDAIDRLG
jgi:hypothetical protein